MKVARAAATAGRAAADREGVERVTILPEPATPAPVHAGWTDPALKPKPKPTTKVRQPGPPAAVLPDEQSAADLAALLDRYRADPAFRAALVALADRLLSKHGDAAAALAASRGWESAVRSLHRDERYAVALADFLAAWKLDRLPVVGDEPAGRQALHSWLLPLFLGWAEGERPTDAHAKGFGGGIFAGVLLPHLWEADGVGRVRGRLLRIEATLTLAYDPTAESWTEAEARLLADAARQRDAIETEHREAGYRLAGRGPSRRERDADWCYRRLVGESTYPALAAEANTLLPEAEQVDDSTVRVAVKAFADRAGISLTRPKPKK